MACLKYLAIDVTAEGRLQREDGVFLPTPLPCLLAQFPQFRGTFFGLCKSSNGEIELALPKTWVSWTTMVDFQRKRC